MRDYLFFLIIIVHCFSCNTKNLKEQQNSDRPNILWITCEDITTMLGCYGDPLASTPNIDNLASKGVLFKNAYSTAPVCSPARSCLVSGVYATSLGTQNLRSDFIIPGFIRTLPHLLREEGYYCSNNYKEDYNFYDSTIWDESSHDAHWRNRPTGKPFFSVFNFETTHQSQIFGDDESFYNKYGRLLTDEERTKPEEINLQPYFFDSPEVRKLWARYYDLVTIMDRSVGDILKQLEEDGLHENTIVFFYSDHGTGMPRAKRALYNSGVKVPFIVYVPEKYKHILPYPPGSETEDIVSFVDLPPTILNFLGITIPGYMQGKPFLGESVEGREFAFASSDRVDEAFEISRTVKSKKFSYIRNFLPHLPLIQPNYYTDQSEIMQELLRLKGITEMTEEQRSMWLPRRFPEELFDLENDPFETNNLAADPAYRDVLLKMRSELRGWLIETHDTGLIPEGYLLANCSTTTAYEIARSNQFFPVEHIIQANDVLLEDNIRINKLIEGLSNDKELIRFWSAVSLQYVTNLNTKAIEALNGSLDDPSIYVQLAAAETLCALNQCNSSAQNTILAGLQSKGAMTSLMAARIFELNRDKALEIIPEVKKIHERLCNESKGKWQGYDLYACWALNEAFK
jgi:arylsulfatase A-like enzyme